MCKIAALILAIILILIACCPLSLSFSFVGA